jgi:hypothetical protein
MRFGPVQVPFPPELGLVTKDYYNTKAYVLHRDGYRCKSRRKDVQHSKKLHVHHIVFRIHGGSDAPSNLITLCERCHDALHAGVFKLHRAGSRSRTKHATQIGIIKASLLKVSDVEPVFLVTPLVICPLDGRIGDLVNIERRQVPLSTG